MVAVVGLHTANNREVVNALRRVRQQLRHVTSALAVFLKRKWTRNEFARLGGKATLGRKRRTFSIAASHGKARVEAAAS